MNEFQDFSYDVIVVGSGAGGGMAAYTLTKAGHRVLMLEAGREYDPTTETPMFETVHQAPLRGVGTPDKDFGFYDATVRRMDCTRRALYNRTEFRVFVVASSNARWPNQSLGTNIAAIQPIRL